MLHKNSQKRYYLENGIYFVTTRTKNVYPYFANSILADLLMNEISIVQKMKRFHLFGYVIIPNHVHLLIQPTGKYNISNIMFSIKKQFAHEANRIMGFNPKKPAPITAGGQTFARLRVYVDTHGMKGEKFGWHASYHDHVIRDEVDFEKHLNYLRYNPIKHGLIKEGETYPFVLIDYEAIRRAIGA